MRFFTLVLIISFLVVSGCTERQMANKKKELEFWTVQLSGFSGYINSVIDQYEELHPNIKIKWVDVPFSEAEKRSLAAVLSNNVPDLINMNPDFAVTLASKGALLDIKQLISENHYRSYLESAWRASGMGEFVYGIPWYMTSAVTVCNTEKYSGKMPETYYDLREIAGRVEGYVLMPALTENGKMLRFFSKDGVPIVNSEKTRAVFNTDRAEEILNFWKIMYQKGFIPKESITEGHRQSLEKFMAGETAFIVAGENFINIIKENAPQLYKNLIVSTQLTGTEGKADFSLMNFVIPKKSRYKDEALDFALYVTNAENQLKFCRLAAVLPSQKQAQESDYFDGSVSAKQLRGELLGPIPALENRKDLYEVIDFMTQEVLLGRKTPRQALDEAVEKWNEILAE